MAHHRHVVGHRTSQRVAGVAAAALTLALVAGCSGDDRPEVGAPIVQPGKPGEESKVLDDAPEVEPADATAADIEFVQMMIPHHAQALEMAELAPDAGGSREVRVMADRIDGAQRPEIVLMAGWLSARDLKAPTKKQIETGQIPMDGHGAHGGHGEGMATHDMAGMASASDMKRLASAQGEAFDRLFLELMVNHHQGAIEMVDDVVRDGADQQVSELATSIAADQTAEIQRMRDLLADL